MKNGKPSGTSTSVSRARVEIVSMSRLVCHVIRNARMLTIGSVSRKAPSRGERFEALMTAITVMPAIAPFMSSGHIGSSFDGTDRRSSRYERGLPAPVEKLRRLGQALRASHARRHYCTFGSNDTLNGAPVAG